MCIRDSLSQRCPFDSPMRSPGFIPAYRLEYGNGSPSMRLVADPAPREILRGKPQMMTKRCEDKPDTNNAGSTRRAGPEARCFWGSSIYSASSHRFPTKSAPHLITSVPVRREGREISRRSFPTLFYDWGRRRFHFVQVMSKYQTEP